MPHNSTEPRRPPERKSASERAGHCSSATTIGMKERTMSETERGETGKRQSGTMPACSIDGQSRILHPFSGVYCSADRGLVQYEQGDRQYTSTLCCPSGWPAMTALVSGSAVIECSGRFFSCSKYRESTAINPTAPVQYLIWRVLCRRSRPPPAATDRKSL